MRLKRMIADLRHPTSHPVAVEFLLRATAVALALVVILGLLPAIVEAAA